MANKSKSDTQEPTNEQRRFQSLPSEPRTLRRTLANLHAFIEQVERACEHGEFVWVAQVFEYLHDQYPTPGDNLRVRRKPHGLKVTSGLLIALQHLDPQDFAARVSVKPLLDAWQAETSKPLGRHPVLVNASARRTHYERTAAKAKSKQALMRNVKKAMDDLVAPLHALRQRILTRLAKVATTNKAPPARAAKQAARKQGWTPPELAERLGVSPDKILAWIRSGELPAVNVSTRRGGRPRYLINREGLTIFEAKRRAAGDPPIKRRRRRQDPGVIEYF